MENKKDTKPQCNPELSGDGQKDERLYFVADAAGVRHDGYAEVGRQTSGRENEGRLLESSGSRPSHELAKPVSVGRRGRRERPDEREIRDGGRSEVQIEGSSEFSRLDDSGGDEHRPDRGTPRETDSLSELNRSSGLSGRIVGASGDGHGQLGDSDRERSQRLRADDGTQGRQDSQRPFGLPDGAIWPGPTNGFWRDAEWIYCRDGKWRPVGTIESGTFEMADELAADLGCVRDQSSGKYTISPLIEKGKGRVMRLRGYGNAIVAEVAIAFIESYLELER